MKQLSLIHTRLTITLATALVLAGLAVAMPGKTVHAVTPLPWCASQGSGLCLSDNGHTAPRSPVVTNNRNVGPNQNISLVAATSACNGGVVTSTCPFDVGSGNNTAFQGLQIITVRFGTTSSNVCVASDTAGPAPLVVTAGCTASGTNWVVVGHSGSSELVNVWWTNHDTGDVPVYLDSEGVAGQQADMQSAAAKPPSNWSY